MSVRRIGAGCARSRRRNGQQRYSISALQCITLAAECKFWMEEKTQPTRIEVRTLICAIPRDYNVSCTNFYASRISLLQVAFFCGQR